MIIEVRGVHFSWPAGPALAGVDFAAEAGEMVAVVGPNGAGKSTLLRVFSGYLKPAQGAVWINGRDVAGYGRRALARLVAFVPQYSEINLPYTVGEFVALGRYPHLGAFRPAGPADRAAVSNALLRAEVGHLAARPLGQLSGGEFQRAVLARAMAQEPSLVFLDEPTAHLDLSHEVRMLELLQRLNRDAGLTVVAVLHDLNVAAAYFPRVVVMNAGRVAADGPPAAVLNAALIGEVYGCPVRVWDDGGRRLIFPEVNVCSRGG